MQTDLLILQDQNEVFSTGIKSEKGKGDNISKALESDDLSEGRDADFLSTLIGITKSRDQGSGIGDQNSESKAESIELGAESIELRAQSPELGAEISELKAESMPSELKAESLGTGALSSELKAESTDTDKAARISTIFKETEGSQIPDQKAEEAQSSKLKAQSTDSEVKAETRLPLQGTSGQGSELKAENTDTDEVTRISTTIKETESSQIPDQKAEEAQSSKLKAQSTDSEVKAETSLPLQGTSGQGSEMKAESTDTGKAARISTIFKETEGAGIRDQGSGIRDQGSGVKVQSAEKAESPRISNQEAKEVSNSQLSALSSQLSAQGLNSNHQEAGEVVKNLIKNQPSHEATPKIESNFQDIKTIAKNMENFDKNFSHKEPDNVLLFPESRSSDRVSDTGLHAKDTQQFQKPLQTEVLTQIVKKAAFNLKNGQTEVKIDLKPEFLGRIQLKISTENHQVMVRMLTEIPLVKDIIENNINHLKADLQNHGLEIDKFDVFLTRDSDQHENGHENAKFLKKNGETGEGEADGILAEEMEEEAQFAHERTGANLIGVFA